MCFRNDQKVDGSLSANVVEGNDLIVLIKLARRDFPGHDLTKQAIHDGSPIASAVQCIRAIQPG